MIMKRICAWCGHSMGYKECQCPPHETIEKPISHGICPECKEKALAEIDSAPAETIKPKE